MDMRANTASMTGANSFTFALFAPTQALQEKMISQTGQNIQEINSRASAMQSIGKGSSINIQV